jgi:hypothetical protein
MTAALWRVERVNSCTFADDADFKRAFEARPARGRQSPAAFGLTGIATMLIKSTQALRADLVRHLVTTLILVRTRTAGGG